MREDFILMFSIEARASLIEELATPEPPPVTARPPGGAGAGGLPHRSENDPIVQLNDAAADTCDKLEREIKRFFPPYVSVQADVHFERGSLLMTGTVAIFSWIGNTALDALKDEAKQQLAGLVKMAVQRVMNRSFASGGFHPRVGPLEVSVTPAGFPAPTPPAPSSTLAPTDSKSSSSTHAADSLSPGATRWLILAVAIIFAAQVLLVLDRFLVIQLR